MKFNKNKKAQDSTTANTFFFVLIMLGLVGLSYVLSEGVLSGERTEINTNQELINVSYNNCSRVEFDYKNASLNAIQDNYSPLNISSQLGEIRNTSFMSSFLINSDLEIEGNNMQVTYDHISNPYSAIRTEYSGDDIMRLDLQNMTSSVFQNDTTQIFFNVAFSDNDDSTKVSILDVYEGNELSLEIFNQGSSIGIINSKTGQETSILKECQNDYEFCMYKLVVDNNGVYISDRSLDSTYIDSPFNATGENISLVSDPQSVNSDSDTYYFRNVLVDTQGREILRDQYSLSSINEAYDKFVWNRADFYIQEDNIFYNINTKSEQIYNGVTNTSTLKINTSKVDIENMYCTTRG